VPPQAWPELSQSSPCLVKNSAGRQDRLRSTQRCIRGSSILIVVMFLGAAPTTDNIKDHGFATAEAGFTSGACVIWYS